MYIEPNTNIRLLSGCPIDEEYKNTLFFVDEEAQHNYFISLTKYNVPDSSYQRVNKGFARIGVNPEQIYDCNYMMFKNNSFGNKWFYAFINSVEYVNNTCAQVNFSIDVVQTWFFDVSLGQCFVEREHVVDDVQGKHTVNEELPYGDYVTQGVFKKTYKPAVVGFFLDGNTESGTVSINVDNNVYSPFIKSYGTIENGVLSGGLVDMLGTFKATPENVALLTMTTEDLAKNDSVTYGETLAQPKTFVFNGEVYTPKNKKLLCYPYNVLSVDNFSGQIEDYKWEDFEVIGQAEFEINGCVSPRPALECYPKNYKNAIDEGVITTNKMQAFSVVYDEFPQCPYQIDTFKAWVSSSFKKTVDNFAIGTAVSAIGLLSGTPIGVTAGVAGIANTVGQLNNARIDYQYNKIHSKSVGGSVSSSALNYSADRIGFRFTYYNIKPEFAKIIDKYFDMFGYKVNTVKVPNISARPHWNYVKTMECVLNGNAPADDIRTLHDIYNHGITFWKNGNEVGNYNLNNSIS